MKKAKDGIYGESQLRNLDRVLIKKYFERVDEKNYRIRDAVKKHVTFKRHDLTTEPPVSRYLDAVFCRNVMIYFTEAQKMKVLNDFYNALISGGYLIIGKSETLPSEFKEKFECVDLREKIYLKKL
ncbi:MAG: chemotaxis protein methyltransferase CheR [Archaeoglobi archaeon]|nr:chemotaxis protein methyltransferase CheR [Archaeoglobi archaeon]